MPGGNGELRGNWGSATGYLTVPNVPGNPRTYQLLCLALGTRIQEATEVFRPLPSSSPFHSPLVLRLLMAQQRVASIASTVQLSTAVKSVK